MIQKIQYRKHKEKRAWHSRAQTTNTSAAVGGGGGGEATSHTYMKSKRCSQSFSFSSPEPTILLVCAKDRDLWQGPKEDRSRKSANHGLPALVRSLRNLNNNGYYRLQKWAAIALARDLVPARGLDPWRRPKGSWALGTRMNRSHDDLSRLFSQLARQSVRF